MHPHDKEQKPGNYREIILGQLLKSGIVLSSLALLPAFILSLKTGRYILIILDFAIACVFLCTCYCNRLKYKQKAVILLAIVYLTSVNIVLNLGFSSGAPAWFFTLGVLAAILFGYRAAAVSIIINSVTMPALAWIIKSGFTGKELSYYPSDISAITAFGNFLLLNAALAFSTAALLDQLEKAVEENTRKGKELRRSEKKYRLIAENVKKVIWTADCNLNITYVAPSVKHLLGIDPSFLLDKNIRFLPGFENCREEAEKLIAKISQSAKDSTDISEYIEFKVRDKNGKERWIEVGAGLLSGSADDNPEYFGSVRDISAKKELADQLERIKRMEALGTLAGGVAHDLNNILSGLVGYPDLILMDLPESSSFYPHIMQIKKAGEKAAEIVQDLLVLSGRSVPRPETVDLNRTVLECHNSPDCSLVAARYPGIEIRLCLSSEIPYASVSPGSLKKSIINLITNALESLKGRGEIVVSTGIVIIARPMQCRYGTISPGRYSLLSVRDNGPGILESDLEHIFEPFYTRKKMGHSVTGLGMTIVQKTVSDCGGHIDVVTSTGNGTEVVLYVPTAYEEKSGIAVRQENREDSLKNRKILVVDDIAVQRELAGEILARLGFQVTPASSGEEAVELAVNEKFDLVLLDMIMEGGMDGLDTFRQLKKINPGQKALIISGFAENGRTKTVLDEGAGGYIKKPYTVDQISSAVRNMLGG